MSNARLRRRLKRHIEEQNGMCWICGFPMMLPNSADKMPSKLTATLDHLSPKNTTDKFAARPTKAAHKLCNSARHHMQKLPKKQHAQIISIFRNMSLASWMQNYIESAELAKKYDG